MKTIERQVHYSHIIVLAGFLTTLGSTGFARFAYTMILPGMKESLGLTYVQMGLIGSGNFITYMIFAIVGGILASKYGPKKVIAISLCLTGISMILTGFSNTFIEALLFRSLTGAFSAIANVPGIMLSATFFSSKRRGLSTGIILTGNAFGLIITGFLVPKLELLYHEEGWRYSWAYLGIMVLIFALFCSYYVRNSPNKKKSLIQTSESLQWTLIRLPVIWKIGIVYFLFGLSNVAYITFIGAYLINEIGLLSVDAGFLWTMLGMCSITSGPLWGYISDISNRRYGLALVFFTQALSIYFTVYGDISFFRILSVIIFGFSVWAIPSIMAAYSGDLFGSQKAFSAFGFLTLFFGIGQIISPTVAGYIADYFQSFSTVFLISSSIALLAGILSLKIAK